MRDIIGQEIEVGDWVVYAPPSTNDNLHFGRVIRKGKKAVTIEQALVKKTGLLLEAGFSTTENGPPCTVRKKFFKMSIQQIRHLMPEENPMRFVDCQLPD